MESGQRQALRREAGLYFRLRGRNAEAGRNHSVLDLYLFSGGGRAGSGGLFGPPSGISYQRSEKAGGPVRRRTSVGSQRAAGAGARSTDLAPQNRGRRAFYCHFGEGKGRGWEDGRKRTYPAYWKDRKALRDYESFLKETIADLGEDSALSRLLDGRSLP